LKRRGSFVLFTAATYVLLFAVAGVMSINAYDARLSDPSLELTLISFVPPQPEKVVSEPVKVRSTKPPAGVAEGPRSIRRVLVDRTDNPLNAPQEVSPLATTIPTANPHTVVGAAVFEPSGSGLRDSGGGPGNTRNAVVVKTVDPPPPAPAPAAKKILRSPGVLNSRALSLPKPSYPILARQTRAQGSVYVQVLIDETGNVISAKSISGHLMLMNVAQQAALQARFSPTMLGDQAVKVSGIIIYNFVLQ
jgi:protein TonB